MENLAYGQVTLPSLTRMELHTVYLTDDGASLAQVTGGALVGLREGLEAGVVVMVLAVLLVNRGRSDALRWVTAGAVGAIVVVIPVILAVYYSASAASGLAIEILSGIASVVAALIVATVVMWLRAASHTYAGDTTTAMATAITAGPHPIAALAFLAVGREGVEIALLMVGHTDGTSLPLLGVAVGVTASAALVGLLYLFARRIDFAAMFRWSGLLLILVSAGILGSGIRALQNAGWLPGATAKAFDASSWFDMSSWYGLLLHGVFGLRPDPTVLQLTIWLAYLVVIVGLFIRPAKTLPTISSAPTDMEQDDNHVRR